MISDLAARVFTTRDIAHREHWKCKSYAMHVALGEFYEESIKAIDAVVENYQGMFAPIESFDVCTTPIKDIRSYLQDEADWIEANLEELSKGSASISNQILALISVYTRTVFLLGLK